MEPETVWDFTAWLLFVYFFALLALVLSYCKRDYYCKLKKPPYCSNAYVLYFFWFFAYILLAWSAYRIWALGGWNQNYVALLIFIAHVIVLHMWYFIFFVTYELFISFIWCVVISVVAIANFVAFILIDLLAALLLIPYFILLLISTWIFYEIYCFNTNFVYHSTSTPHNHLISNNLNQKPDLFNHKDLKFISAEDLNKYSQI